MKEHEIPKEVALLMLELELDAFESYLGEMYSKIHHDMIDEIKPYSKRTITLSDGEQSKIEDILRKAEAFSMTIQSKWKRIPAFREKAGELNATDKYHEQIFDISDMFADLLIVSFATIDNAKKILALYSCPDCGSPRISNDGEGDIVCLTCGGCRCE